MKTLKTLGLLLFVATGILAQPTANDMFISGYVTDQNGNAQANHEVCVSFVSNNPALPSDTICTNTNANGYYSIIVVNGSLTGPNVSFDVSTLDSCAQLPLIQTIDNQQGTVDSADVDFVICASGGCSVDISYTLDTTGGGIVYEFGTDPQSQLGQPPYTGTWIINGNQQQFVGTTVTYQAFANQIIDVCLEITNSDGCTATSCDTIFVGNIGCDLEVDIVPSVDTTNGIIQSVLTAVATNGATPYSFAWDPTLNTTAILNWGELGEHCVTVTDNNGCVATACDTLVSPNGACDAFITSTYDSITGTVLTANSAGVGPFTYVWSNQASTQSITYLDPGLPYCVTITDATGCQVTVCDTVGVNNGCSATITVANDPVFGITMTANATGIAPFSYQWDDPMAQTTATAYVANFLPGMFCVTVADATGCEVTVCDTVGSNNNCDVELQYDNSLGSDLFTAIPSGIAPFSYSWNTGEITQTIDVLGIPGTYCVTVTDATGCQTANVCDTLTNTCEAFLEASTDSSGNVILSAIGTGTGPFTYLWDDNQTGQSIINNQPFPHCVTITDASGCSATVCDSTGCLGFEPNVQIVSSIDSTGGGLAYFLDGGAGYTVYDWSDGSTTQTAGPFQPGPNGQVICLTVINQYGCSATKCDTLLPINNTGCQAAYNWSVNWDTSQGLAYPIIEFTDLSADSIASWWWTFGDGDQSAFQNPEHIYPIFGLSYETCLTIETVDGCVSTVCDTVVVPPASNGNCDASFTTAGPTPSGIYTLTADHDFNGWDYAWTVNNLVVSTVSELETSLPTGVNEVCLTITDSLNNCTGTQCETIISGCDAAFTSSGPDSTGQYSFNADIQNPAWDYLWTSNNQPISSVSIMQTSLPNGVNEVCLTVVDSVSNCSDTQCQTITAGQCNASFTNFGVDSITGEYTFSADVQSPDWNYLWTANNLVVSSVSILETPLSMGVNEICLTVTDSVNNCSETECQTVTVNNNSCYGYISGEIYAGSNNQPLNNGVVYLITYDTATNMLDAVHTIDLGPGNIYQFGPLPCGDYMIKAAASQSSPYYSDHIPTYHGNSPFWSFAQMLSLSQVNTQVTADVVLIAATNPGGPGFIGGDVTQGANKVDPGDPLEGMQVMLFNLSGGAIAYTYTDGNGEFGFSNLAYGTYQVYVEVVGVPTIPAYVTIGPNNPSEGDIHIYATYELVTTGIEEFDFDGAISEVYPNPVGDDAWINFNLERGAMVKISILDLTGRTVSTTTRSITSGDDQVRFDVDGLTDGYYFLNIQEEEGAFTVTRKFMKVD